MKLPKKTNPAYAVNRAADLGRALEGQPPTVNISIMEAQNQFNP